MQPQYRLYGLAPWTCTYFSQDLVMAPWGWIFVWSETCRGERILCDFNVFLINMCMSWLLLTLILSMHGSTMKLRKVNHKSHRIFSVDATGITAVQCRHSTVVSMRGKTEVASLTSAERENLMTVVTRKNANGTCSAISRVPEGKIWKSSLWIEHRGAKLRLGVYVVGLRLMYWLNYWDVSFTSLSLRQMIGRWSCPADCWWSLLTHQRFRCGGQSQGTQCCHFQSEHSVAIVRLNTVFP